MTFRIIMGFFNKLFSKEKKETLDNGLERTKQGLFSKITRAVAGKSKIDDDVLDNLEEVFITSDVGVETTLKIITASRSVWPGINMWDHRSLTNSFAKKYANCLPRTITNRPRRISPYPPGTNPM